MAIQPAKCTLGSELGGFFNVHHAWSWETKNTRITTKEHSCLAVSQAACGQLDVYANAMATDMQCFFFLGQSHRVCR